MSYRTKLATLVVVLCFCCGCGSADSSRKIHPVTGEWPLDILPEMSIERDVVLEGDG